jgi:thioredoxin-like negative regulator of GroEL
MPDPKYAPASGETQLSYIQQNLKTTSSFPGFFPHEEGRQMAQSQLKPLVLYFYTQQATQCINQDQILQDYNAARYQGRVIFAEVNTMDFPQISQQYGVFRVPCWIFFDKSGAEKFRDKGILTPQKLDQYIRTIAP